IDKDGSKKRPIMLHRVIFGYIERFIGILIEHFAGLFPLWLASVKAVVIPVSSEYKGEYASKVYEEKKNNNIRVELDNRNEKLGYRLREAQTRKINYTLILGDKEKTDNTISYRKHGEKDTTTVSIDEFISLLKDEITT